MKCLMAEVNFSEGKDQSLIGQVRDAMLDGEPIELMEISSDADHNRTVFTFKGGAQSGPGGHQAPVRQGGWS